MFRTELKKDSHLQFRCMTEVQFSKMIKKRLLLGNITDINIDILTTDTLTLILPNINIRLLNKIFCSIFVCNSIYKPKLEVLNPTKCSLILWLCCCKVSIFCG